MSATFIPRILVLPMKCSCDAALSLSCDARHLVMNSPGVRRHRKVCAQTYGKESSSLGSTLREVAARAYRHLADRP